MNPEPSSFALPRRRSRAGLWVLVLLAFVAGLAAMALMMRHLPERLRPAAATPVAPARPVAAPAVSPAPALTTAEALGVLGEREVQLAARLGELEARLRRTEIDAADAGAQAGRAEGLLVAFAARRALDRGQSLGYLAGELRQRFGATDPRAVSAVLAAAREPVTLEDLRFALDTIARQLVGGDPRESWWQRMRRELGQLVVIRHEATPTPSPSDRLADARRRLAAGQVEAALAEVERMPGASAATSWTAAARRYVRGRNALVALETGAIRAAAPPVLAGSPVAAEASPAPFVAPAADAPLPDLGIAR